MFTTLRIPDSGPTTRLHGMVMALKNGILALVVDPIAGGAKKSCASPGLSAGTQHLSQTPSGMRICSELLDYCLSNEARIHAVPVRRNAMKILSNLREDFLEELGKLAREET